ncbi:MAG: RNA methyltransferase [Deltaproteobacteria bacterium]|nr:RNA methyltransferase [Deltaproteobacteria bacterium]
MIQGVDTRAASFHNRTVLNTSACSFFVTCAKGTEGALRRELAALRIGGPRGATGGVSFSGTLMDGMKVCLHSRVAMRVLLEIAAFAAPDADHLYAETREIDWTDFVGHGMTIAVSATTHANPHLRHSGFAALKVKDALADRLRERTGRRPDVAPRNPDVSIVLHVRGQQARLFVDLAGEPLHRRGYRAAMVEAPLKESLAAAMLSLGAVAIDKPFLDPMAGSGTLAIEHAMAARGIAPGLHRRFGFERWIGPEQRRIWDSLVKAARAGIRPNAPCPILARDKDKAAVAAARRNAEAAFVLADITFEVGDFTTLAPREPAGTLCTNPPYGERLEVGDAGTDVRRLYAGIARTLDRMRGWRAVFLAGNPALAQALGRKPAVVHRLWNGPIEARLLVYDL